MEEKSNGAFQPLDTQSLNERIQTAKEHEAARAAAWQQHLAMGATGQATYGSRIGSSRAAYEQRMNAQMSPEVRGMAAVSGLRAGDPNRLFTRVEVLISLRAILASKGGLAEAILAFENME